MEHSNESPSVYNKLRVKCMYMYLSFCILQLTVHATDNSPSPLTGVATVTINIIRNAYAPEFDRDSYTVTISEYQNQDSFVTKVHATDRDNINSTSGQLKYKLSHPYYNIDESTGNIIIKKHLRTDEAYAYNVSNVSYLLRTN